MENIIANKVKFFALYWGQRAVCYVNDPSVMTYPVNAFFGDMEAPFLELKPLSSISDYEAIQLARIICPDMFINLETGHYIDRTENGVATVAHKRSARSVDISYEGIVEKFDEDLGFMHNPYMAHGIDFLRSTGYALPYMGISVDELIEWGWIKLKGDPKP